MRNIAATFVTELLKLRRSNIVIISLIFFIFVPIMIGLMMYVARNPEMSAKLGMVGTKAQLFGRSDWSGYFDLVLQMTASLGLIGFGFVSSWVFGREHTERTIKDMLALPVSRASIVISKFIIITLWCSVLAIEIYVFSIISGFVAGVTDWSIAPVSDFTQRFLLISFLTLLLCTPVAFFASYGRGIIGAIGFVIITLIMAQFVALLGLGAYFPWAIPGLHSVPADTHGMQVSILSYMIIITTSLIGFIACIQWWRRADQH